MIKRFQLGRGKRRSVNNMTPPSDSSQLDLEVEIAQREREFRALLEMGLTPAEESVRLDTQGSVSAMVEVEGLYAFVTEDMTDEQYRRFHHGS